MKIHRVCRKRRADERNAPGDRSRGLEPMSTKMSATYCPLPWYMAAVRSNGDLRVCCQANQSENKGILKKEDGTNYNIAKDDVLESRNAPLLKEIRLALLRGERHPNCVRCWREEDSGLTSARMVERRRSWAGVPSCEDAAGDTLSDGSLAVHIKPKLLDLRLGNMCNLRCRMCAPTDSSSWYDDFVELSGATVFWETHGHVRLVLNEKNKYEPLNHDYAWIKSEHFWTQIEAMIPHLEYVYIVGGEPLIIGRHYKFLRRCIEARRAGNIILEYNTNLTSLPAKALELWRHFREVRLGVSLDGWGRVNDYIRYPSKWKGIEKNLERIDKAGGNIQSWLTVTVTTYNIFYLPDFIGWQLNKRFRKIGSQSRPFGAWHPCHRPEAFNIQCFPPGLKDELANHLRSSIPILDVKIDRYAPDVEAAGLMKKLLRRYFTGYINYMNLRQLAGGMSQFWSFTKRLDEIRGQSFEKTFPEFYDFISDYLPVNGSAIGERRAKMTRASEIISGEGAKEIRPTSIRLEAATLCQLRCPTCPTAQGKIKRSLGAGFLKGADFRKFLDRNPWISRIELSNWGEIFLNPDLVSIIKHAFRKDVALTAVNGVNLNAVRDGVLRALVKYKFRAMTCSIDGASAQSYRVHRRNGDFNEVIRNIKKINYYKTRYKSEYPTLMWQFVVFGHNEAEIPAAKKMARDLDMSISFKLSWDEKFSPPRNSEFIKKQTGLRVTSRSECRKRRVAQKMARDFDLLASFKPPGDGIPPRLGNGDAMINKSGVRSFGRGEYRGEYGTSYLSRICSQLWNNPQINWDGRILGCCVNWWGDFGTLSGWRLSPGLNNEKIRYAKRMLQGEEEARADIPCARCPHYHARKEDGAWVSASML